MVEPLNTFAGLYKGGTNSSRLMSLYRVPAHLAFELSRSASQLASGHRVRTRSLTCASSNVLRTSRTYSSRPQEASRTAAKPEGKRPNCQDRGEDTPPGTCVGPPPVGILWVLRDLCGVAPTARLQEANAGESEERDSRPRDLLGVRDLANC